MKNKWSMITIRVALVCSPAAYEASISFKIFQLPSRSTLQMYTSAFLDEAGTQQLIAYAPFTLDVTLTIVESMPHLNVFYQNLCYVL